MSEADKKARETWLVLEQMHQNELLASSPQHVEYEVEKSEKIGYPSVSEQIGILHTLEKLGAIKILTSFDPERPFQVIGLQNLPPKKTGDLSRRGVYFEKLPSRFDELYEEYSQHKTDAPSALKFSQYWVVKDENGEYWFDGNKVYFKNANADYVKIFAAVCTAVPHGGMATYSKVKSLCKAKDAKAIQRALTGKYANFFRYVPSINRIVAYGVPLFEASTNGKQIKFNNKRS